MAQTNERKVQERAGVDAGHPIAANAPTIFAGAIVLLLAGDAIPGRVGADAAEAETMVAVGIAKKTVTVADGMVPTRAGCFLFKNATAADAITRAEIGKTAFVIDDETVGKTNPTNIRAEAGTIIDVESVGVWVRIGV